MIKILKWIEYLMSYNQLNNQLISSDLIAFLSFLFPTFASFYISSYIIE